MRLSDSESEAKGVGGGRVDDLGRRAPMTKRGPRLGNRYKRFDGAGCDRVKTTAADYALAAEGRRESV